MKKIYLVIVLMLIALSAFCQLPESEPNGSFSTSNPIQVSANITATVGGTDADDYFSTVLPVDGTLKVYITATNTAAISGSLTFSGYDRRKVTTAFSKLISGSSSFPAGVTIIDSVTLQGQASDTFYFRFTTNRTFNYQFNYIMIDQSTNDIEPNNNFTSALPIVPAETKSGHSNYIANGSTLDPDDFYRTIFPADGTIKIYVKGTNRGSSAGNFLMYGYDRRKTATVFGRTISGSSSIPAGAVVYDTITVFGQAADTFYFQLNSSRPFAYDLRYEITDQSTNDPEPNNSFASSAPLLKSETKSGHTNYIANGSTLDPDDFYRTIFPDDGTIKIYVKGINRGSSAGNFLMYGYDRRKTAAVFGRTISGSSSIPAGAVVYDTITVYGQAADTFYFQLNSTRPFAYDFRYEIADQGPNDPEPNNSFASSTSLAKSEIRSGHTNYIANGSTFDPDDFYRTVFPVDGTIRIYVKGINRGSSAGNFSMYGYDRRKTSTVFSKSIGGSGSIPPGAVVYDTITLYGQAADTFYFQLNSSRPFAYDFRYEISDTSANDTEPNNAFAEAIPISGTEVKNGHTGYQSNGGSDAFDYYKTVFTSSDSLKLFLQATNYSGAAATFTFQGYNTAFAQIYSRTKTGVPAGATVYDSVKMAITGAQTIYNKLGSTNDGFSYQISINSKLPGNGFTISGPSGSCNSAIVYKALNVADNDVSYHWSLSSGGSLTFVDSIATITWTSPGTHTISLYLQNTYGVSVTKQFTVIVNNFAPATAPAVTLKGRYLDIANLPAATERRWFKDGVYLNLTDSVIYATAAGAYTAKYANSCGEGPASAAVTFNVLQTQTISFPPVPDIGYGADSFRILPATASSGLPVTYSLVSGPGILRGDSLFVTAAGIIVVQASQFGNINFGAATPVNDTINVVKGPQVITFNIIPGKIYGGPDFALDAWSSSGLTVSYSILSGPATVTGNRLKMTGAGTVLVKAKQAGNINYLAAAEVTQSFCIGIRQVEPIVGPAIACPSSIRYTTKKIAGAIYEWSVDAGGTISNLNDTAIVLWQTTGTHTLSVKAYSACDTVRSAAQSIAVAVLAVYNTGAVNGLIPADNTGGLSLPLALQWSPVANATSYDLYVWPSVLPQPALPLDSNLIQLNYLLTKDIALNTAYSWKVVAKNVCTSSTSAVQQFTVVQNSNSKPDLVLDTFYFQPSIYEGQPVTVTWRVKNIGMNGTGLSAWKDRVYLSPSLSIRTSESTLLGAYNNPAYLLPGETYTQTKTVTIPPGDAGTWYLGVITDNEEAYCFNSYCNVFWGPGHYNHNENLVQESNEYNNYRNDEVNILNGPLPDLQVKSVAVPGAVFSGNIIPVTYKVKNEGSFTAAGKVLYGCPQRAWRDRFFISNLPVFNISTSTEIAGREVRFLKPGTTNCVAETIPYIDYLFPDSSYTIQHDIQLPFNLSGKQYIYVFTNGYGDAYEGPYSTNNIRGSDSFNVTQSPPADLLVSNISNVPNSVSGTSIDINYAVVNQGANAPYEQNWTDSIFICSTPAFSYTGIVAKTKAVILRPANFITAASYNRTVRMQIPDDISGTYYVFVKTDARQEVFEYNQENNNSRVSNPFTITLSPPVDLQITSIISPDTVRIGVPFNVVYTIRNNGTGTVRANWWDYFYAAQDATVQDNGNAVCNLLHPLSDSLPANTQKTFTRQAVINSSSLASRLVFIKGKADALDAIYEHQAETNNVFVNLPGVYVKPALVDEIDRRSDIALQSFTAPSGFTANTNINLNWTVKNNGILATTKTHWQDRVIISRDTIISSDDVELKKSVITQYTNTGLLPDSQYQRSASVKVPIDLYGSYYLVACTDYTGSVLNDSTQDDNYIRVPVTVIPAPVPDLVITPQNNLPDTVWGGAVFYVKFKVQNQGTDTARGSWYDGLYLHQTPDPGGSPAIKHNLHSTALAPGAFYIDSLLIQVPGYMSGDYYFILSTDRRKEIYEGAAGELNNLNSRLKNILAFNSRPAPDLVVTALSIPDSAILGKDITASFRVKNIGAYPAAGNLSNSFYFSANSIFESNLDKLTASGDANNISLQPGDSLVTQLTGKAVPDLPGVYRGLLRTNVRNTVYEGAYTNNNIRASDTTVRIDARVLPLNVVKPDTLLPDDGSYYKITVAAGLDLSIALTTPYAGNGTNSLYVAYNHVPNELNYDATGINVTTLNQQVLISGTQAGTYYLKAKSFGIAVNEPVSLLAASIPFSIINVSPAAMGNGNVSGTLLGGGFKTNTQIILRKSGISYTDICKIRQLVNSTKLLVQWDLSAVPLGVYDVVAINPGNIETVLAASVTIEIKNAYKLEYTPLLPAEVRPFGSRFTYKGKNIGNVNIELLQGDITMVEKNATVIAVQTTGNIRRYTKYAQQYDSLSEKDWYIDGKNRVIPFLGRNIAPGESFSITVEVRFKGSNVRYEQNNIFPLQCRMFGYSTADFIRDQVRNMEMMRLLLINNPKATLVPNSQLIRDGRAGSKVFVEKMMNEYVNAGLMNWTDTTGLNFRWDCSRCLQLLPEIKPTEVVDSFAFNPGGQYIIGKDSLGTGQVFRKNQKMLLEMNKGLYWWYYDGAAGPAGMPGENKGWDMLDIHGTLFIDATAQEPFKIVPTSLHFDQSSNKNISGQLGGWSPAYDTSYLIVVASGGINGYDTSNIVVDTRFFTGQNDMRNGHFETELRRGYGLGADSIMLAWKAFRPGPGEPGVDGVNGGPEEPGSPGGKGGAGNASHPKGGKGGKGGRGSDEVSSLWPAMTGGRGGAGGDGYGDGGDGGDAGETGDALNGPACKGEAGGPGTNAGSHGGGGGTGGKGAKGGNAGFGTVGGKGGAGGDGGMGVNSGYGGRGGDGGEGGRGGSACGSGKQGGNGGAGGHGGSGPLGLSADGSSGRKGLLGDGLDCPPCTGLLPAGADAEAAADEIIDKGKTAYGVITDLIGGSTKSLAMETLNQTVGEFSPGAKLMVEVADAALDVLIAGSTAEYQVGMKVLITVLKVGDYTISKGAHSQWYDSNLKPVVTSLISGLSVISSPSDVAAGLLKLFSQLANGIGVSLMVKPCDPNEIVGPAGFSRERFVSSKASMPYMIHFENDSTAEVSAQRVVVRQPISLKADPLSFKLGSFNFGGHSFDVPDNSSTYFKVLNFDSLGYRVQVTAGVDILNRQAFWIFQTIDPETGLPPANVFIGMLPVNDSTENGTGYVTYTIKPLSTAITGDSIIAKAAIVFDENEPMETNTWSNTIDAFAPVSSISNLPDSTADTEINLHYTGHDDLGGSGTRFFNLYVSDNGAVPVLYMQQFTGTDSTYLGTVGHTYRFYIQATDNVGNIESLVLADSVKIIEGQQTICPGSSTSFDTKVNAAAYQWQVDNGSGYANLVNSAVYSGANSKVLSLNNPPGSMYGYRYRCVINGNTVSQEFILKFGMTWSGTVSTAWENPANWSCNVLPELNTDVTINGNAPNYPQVNSNVIVRTLRLNAGASGVVNTGYSLKVMK